MAEAPPPRPRWVKFAGVAVVLVVVALAIGKIAGLEHGPGMHGSGGGASTQQSDGAGGHQPPDGIPDHSQPPR